MAWPGPLGLRTISPWNLYEQHGCSPVNKSVHSATSTRQPAEILHPFLQRLYEKFNFFELSFDYVAEELQRLRSNRY